MAPVRPDEAIHGEGTGSHVGACLLLPPLSLLQPIFLAGPAPATPVITPHG